MISLQGPCGFDPWLGNWDSHMPQSIVKKKNLVIEPGNSVSVGSRILRLVISICGFWKINFFLFHYLMAVGISKWPFEWEKQRLFILSLQGSRYCHLFFSRLKGRQSIEIVERLICVNVDKKQILYLKLITFEWIRLNHCYKKKRLRKTKADRRMEKLCSVERRLHLCPD